MLVHEANFTLICRAADIFMFHEQFARSTIKIVLSDERAARRRIRKCVDVINEVIMIKEKHAAVFTAT